jgi:ubiquitin-conjugating enzyme E2 Q
MLEPPSYATPTATKTLNRNLREVLEIQKKTPLHELGWYIDQELVSNVYQWIVELHSFDASLPLAQDMKKAGVTSVVLEVRFGKDYPFSPPFLRVIRPRFLPFAAGGGGHVTAGGAMCMELLTNSGWSSVSTIESVLLQVRMAIMNTEPKPARLETLNRGHQRDYGTAEAIDAFIRACRAHGWTVPPGFQDFAGSSGF